MLHGSHIILLQVKRVLLILELVSTLIGQGVQPVASASNNDAGPSQLGPSSRDPSVVCSESRALGLGF